jgi:hypothetical protein
MIRELTPTLKRSQERTLFGYPEPRLRNLASYICGDFPGGERCDFFERLVEVDCNNPNPTLGNSSSTRTSEAEMRDALLWSLVTVVFVTGRQSLESPGLVLWLREKPLPNV